jgi:PEP-CTERM motif
VKPRRLTKRGRQCAAWVQSRYDLGYGVQSLTTIRIENDRGTVLGASVSSQWDWDLRGLDVSSYEISFTAAGTSLSFDSATLDTLLSASTIPEPSSWALAGIGLGILLIQSRRIRRASGHVGS